MLPWFHIWVKRWMVAHRAVMYHVGRLDRKAVSKVGLWLDLPKGPESHLMSFGM